MLSKLLTAGPLRRRGRVLGGIVCVVLIGVLSATTDARAANYGDVFTFAAAYDNDWSPDYLAVDSTGDLFIAPTLTGDDTCCQVTEATPSGTETVLPQVFGTPEGLAVDSAGDLFVSDGTQITEVAVGGSVSTARGNFSDPTGLAVDSAGDLFVADLGNNRIVKVTPRGIETTVVSGITSQYIAADGTGDVFFPVSDGVEEMSTSGTESLAANLGYEPEQVAVDSMGDVIVNTGNGATTVIAPDGGQTAFYVTRRGTDGLAVDAAGDIFVGDNDEFGVADVREIPVVGDTTATSLACSGPAPAGTGRTCTVTVSDTQTQSNVPTGAVALSASGQGSFSDTSCTLQGGTCSVTYTPAVAGSGSQTLSASYPGDHHHEPSAASTTLQITGTTSATSVTCTQPTAKQRAKVALGKAILLNCKATTKASHAAPTGTETFTASPSDDTAEGFPTGASCTVTRQASGRASCSVQFETAAADDYTITAKYSSDPRYFVSDGQATLSTE